MVNKTIYEVLKEGKRKPPKTIIECIEERDGIRLSISTNNMIWRYDKEGYAVKRIDYHTTYNGMGYNIVFKKHLFKGFHRQQDY